MLSRPQLKTLASSIYYYFQGRDKPAAELTVVPIDAIKQSSEGANIYHATVRYIVNYCGRKTHSVRIKFQVDDNGRFVTKGWTYV